MYESDRVLHEFLPIPVRNYKKHSFYKPMLGMHPHKKQECVVYICTPGREPPNLFGFGRTPSQELGDWTHQYLDKYKSVAFAEFHLFV